MKITQPDFHIHCYKVYDQVKKNIYDGILCPLKGGFYLSYFIGRKMNLPLRYVEISSYEGKEQKEISMGPTFSNMTMRGHYLICDDIYDTGDTIRYLEEFYKYCTFDTAVLISKQDLPEIKYSELCDPEEWVDFWWEYI